MADYLQKRRNKKYRGYKKRASTRRRHRGKAYQKDSKECVHLSLMRFSSPITFNQSAIVEHIRK